MYINDHVGSHVDFSKAGSEPGWTEACGGASGKTWWQRFYKVQVRGVWTRAAWRHIVGA